MSFQHSGQLWLKNKPDTGEQYLQGFISVRKDGRKYPVSIRINRKKAKNDDPDYNVFIVRRDKKKGKKR